MAYLRREKEIVETDFPLETVWAAVFKVVASLEWAIEETDESIHRLKIRTKGALMSYSSMVTVDILSVSENTTRINVSVETPVTTLTGIVDFGRTRERVDSFLMALMAQLGAKSGESEKAK
jgi:hypothetical protein